MKIAVVILNWNGLALLKTFLPSVVSYSEEAEIIVADNNSTDTSIAFLKSQYPQIRIIQNTVNGGYAKGYNDALKHVNADVFCLLNNDVEVTKNWLKPILKDFKTHNDLGIIQPKILDYNKKNKFEYAGAAGGFIDKYGYLYCRGRVFNTIETDKGQYDTNVPIFWASGACFFIKADLFKSLNGFDEYFFAHMEEIDLCWRAHHLNRKIMFNSASVVYHKGGATLSALNPKKTFLNFRNNLFILVKNSSEPLFPLLPIRLMLDGFAGIRFLAQFKFKHTLAIVRAHLSFYTHFSRLLRQRKQLNRVKSYYSLSSVVWLYFIARKKTYTALKKCFNFF